MFTIDKKIVFEQIINKSRFICYLFPVKNIEDVNIELTTIKKKHYDATHNCYSYILGIDAILAKSSDDGEPSGTAGIVIYDILKKNKLTNVLAIVTRYFGGIKLGAGGLIRAYGSSVAKALENTNLIKIEKQVKIKLEFDYTYVNSISKLINNYPEISKSFQQNIEIEILIPEDKKEDLFNDLIETTKNNIKIKVIQ